MIRIASREDIPSIQQMASEIWWPTYSAILSEEQISLMLEEIYNVAALSRQMDEGAVFIICSDGIRDVGFASFSPIQDAEGVFKLHKLYLQPSLQGKGLGKRLIEEAERLAIEAGGRVMELNVNRFNKAKDFYLSRGYKIEREEDIPFFQYYMNDYVLRRELKR